MEQKTIYRIVWLYWNKNELGQDDRLVFGTDTQAENEEAQHAQYLQEFRGFEVFAHYHIQAAVMDLSTGYYL